MLAATLAAGLAPLAHAAVSFTGTPVQTNFDGIAGNAGTIAFANDLTIPGLYLYISGGSSTSSIGAAAGSPDAIYRGTGTASAGSGSATYPSGSSFAFYFYRPTGSTDVALGLYNADSNSVGLGTGYIAAGLAYVNNTGQSIPSVVFDYAVTASTATNFTNTDFITVSYSFNATGVADADATWIDVPGLGFSVTGGGVVTGASVNTISGMDWAPGSTLFIRFRDANVGGTDRLSFIDDITLVPEPTSMALLGLGGAMFAMRRRVQR